MHMKYCIIKGQRGISMIKENRFNKKLKSQSGASVALALLVFLLCSLVSGAIIAAASASSGTLANAINTDKETYLLKSATKVVDTYFEDKEWSAKDETFSDGKIESPSLTTVDNLYRVLSCNTFSNGSATSTFTVMANKGNTTPVIVTATMDDSFNITLALKVDDTTQTLIPSTRTMVVKLQAATTGGTTTQEKSVLVTWSSADVSIQ